MAIITVEQENTSREYDVRTLMQMVQTHQQQGWRFFLPSAVLASITQVAQEPQSGQPESFDRIALRRYYSRGGGRVPVGSAVFKIVEGR